VSGSSVKDPSRSPQFEQHLGTWRRHVTTLITAVTMLGLACLSVAGHPAIGNQARSVVTDQPRYRSRCRSMCSLPGTLPSLPTLLAALGVLNLALRLWARRL